MGVCLRGKMAEAGLLPAQVPQPSAEAPILSAPTAAPAEPQPDAAPAVPDNLIGATFGLLRAEPDGSVVIAGSGTPGTEVEIYSNGSLLGRATVESSGDWVLVPDQPIPPGGTELTLAETGKEGQASQSFVVVINEDRSSEPLVVASTPGAASEVLQGLDRPQAAATADIAAAAPAPAPAAEPPAPADQPAAVAPEPPATSQPAAPEASASGQPAAPSAPAADPAQIAEPPAAEPAPAEPAAPAAIAPETAVAAAAPTEPAPAAPFPSVLPTIDAIEIEGDRAFFAGAGPEGATMRLYVDGTHIADTIVSDGRWLIEAGNVLTAPSQRVRVDMLRAGTADVAGRAEVDFVVNLPEAQPPIAVAEAQEPPASDASPNASAPTPADQPAPSAETVPAAPASSENATAPAPAPAQSASAPAAEPTAPAAAPASPATAEADVPTMVAVATGDPEAQRFASGKAIIRRGDNLWTIARRVYGAGIKYTTIYQANTGQIRDPDRIYPGQVFELPGDGV
jgi:hypothetical protein